MKILKAYLKRKHLTASQLAAYAGISKSGMSLYLAGKRTPEAPQLLMLHNATRIPIAKLMASFGISAVPVKPNRRRSHVKTVP